MNCLRLRRGPRKYLPRLIDDIIDQNKDPYSREKYWRELAAIYGNNGNKISTEELIAFLGPPPELKDLPDWLKSEPDQKKLEDPRAFFSMVPQALCCDSNRSHAEVRLYCVLHKFCPNKDRLETFVGQEELAKCLGCSKTYVSLLTKSLEQAGWIEVFRQRKSSNRIKLLKTAKTQTIQGQLTIVNAK